jgi:predicted MFS family arabinose efflux permease
VLLLDLTGSSAAPAAYMLARVVPRLAGAAVGGELADRFRPQRVSALICAVQGGLMASIVPAAQHRLVWPIYAAVALSQLLGAAARPALLSLLPRLVSEERLGRANGVLSAAMSSSTAVAPALSVPLLQVMSPQNLIWLDVLSFAIAGGLLLTMRVAADGGEAGPGLLRDAAAGVRVVWRDGHLRALAGASLASAMAVTTAGSVLVVAAAERLGGADRVGALYAGVGIGSLIGSVLALRRRAIPLLRSTIVAGVLAEIVLLSVFTLCGQLATAVATLAASGGVAVLYQVWGTTELQQRVAGEVLGRASAAVVGAQYAGMILGALLALVLVPPLGWDHALFTACCAAVAVVAASSTGPLFERPGRAPAV